MRLRPQSPPRGSRPGIPVRGGSRFSEGAPTDIRRCHGSRWPRPQRDRRPPHRGTFPGGPPSSCARSRSATSSPPASPSALRRTGRTMRRHRSRTSAPQRRQANDTIRVAATLRAGVERCGRPVPYAAPALRQAGWKNLRPAWRCFSYAPQPLCVPVSPSWLSPSVSGSGVTRSSRVMVTRSPSPELSRVRRCSIRS